ncbi:MAG: hypothetical protein Q9187_002607 [Circinaria calcarea]
MNSPPLRPKPRSILPSRLVNGSSSLNTSDGAKERQRLFASIESLSFERQPIDLDSAEDREPNGNEAYVSKPNRQYRQTPISHTQLSEAARDPRDEASLSTLATSSRPASPYTLSPPIDFDGLSWPSLGTRARLEATPEETQKRLLKLQGAVKTILECIGEDPDREGLRKTPERYAQAMLFFTKGYEENVRDLVNGAVFHEDHDELVILKDIEVGRKEIEVLFRLQSLKTNS